MEIGRHRRPQLTVNQYSLSTGFESLDLHQKEQMKIILNFWRDSFRSNPIAFYLELISFIFVVIATVLLSISAKNPNMALIYPFFLLSSLSAIFAHLRRKLAWPLLASSYFVCVNIVGFIRAIS